MSSAQRRLRRAQQRAREQHRQGRLDTKLSLAFSAAHEAAHAVTALAVGLDVERVYLTPKPQAAIDPDARGDEYQIAVTVLAGPLADYYTGLVPGRDEPDFFELLREPPTKDLMIVMGCAYKALGIEMGKVVGERDGLPLHEAPSADVRERRGPELVAWHAAVEQVAEQILAHNRAAIRAVTRALYERPAGLTGAEVREVAGPIAVLSVERLHDAIDSLALAALDAGSAATTWRQASKLATQIGVAP